MARITSSVQSFLAGFASVASSVVVSYVDVPKRTHDTSAHVDTGTHATPCVLPIDSRVPKGKILLQCAKAIEGKQGAVTRQANPVVGPKGTTVHVVLSSCAASPFLHFSSSFFLLHSGWCSIPPPSHPSPRCQRLSTGDGEYLSRTVARYFTVYSRAGCIFKACGRRALCVPFLTKASVAYHAR